MQYSMKLNLSHDLDLDDGSYLGHIYHSTMSISIFFRWEMSRARAWPVMKNGMIP